MNDGNGEIGSITAPTNRNWSPPGRCLSRLQITIQRWNILDKAKEIKEKHSLEYDDESVTRMTKYQWKSKVKNKVSITVQKSLQQECHKMKKLNHAKTDDANIKWYIKNVLWKAARTTFEVGSNMVKIDSNFGKSESQCCICGQNETTRHLFECDNDLTIDMYRPNKIMKDGRPREEKTVLEEYAARIQRAIQQRTQIKKIIQQYGWAPEATAPLQRSVRKKDRINHYYYYYYLLLMAKNSFVRRIYEFPSSTIFLNCWTLVEYFFIDHTAWEQSRQWVIGIDPWPTDPSDMWPMTHQIWPMTHRI